MPIESKQETSIKFTCDNPACKLGNGVATVLQWTQEEIQEDASKLPARAWRMIRITLFNTNTFNFCSIGCSIHWLAHIKPLDPPDLTEKVVEINRHPDFPGNGQPSEAIAG